MQICEWNQSIHRCQHKGKPCMLVVREFESDMAAMAHKSWSSMFVGQELDASLSADLLISAV